MNNLNTKIVMLQKSKAEADAATQTMGKEFSPQAMRLGTGHALVDMHESKATVLAQMAPSPFELMRNDNTGTNANNRQPALASVGDDLEF
jgi:bifunctional N-acetylglucosamine-1-phosphate-uridyltransferase/glucosamine-1-phosphate-acetyltransferase GlmU-like protein